MQALATDEIWQPGCEGEAPGRPRGTSRRSWWIAALALTATSFPLPVPARARQQTQPVDAGASRATIPLEQIAGAPAPPAPGSAPAAKPDPAVEDACARARASLEDGQPGAALSALEAITGRAGADGYEACLLRARAHAALRDLTAALAQARAAVRRGYGRADAHVLLGRLLVETNQREEALAHFRTATLAADRELNNLRVTLAWFALGHLLDEQGYTLAAAQAYAHFDEAIWVTHVEHRNAPEIAALLKEHAYGMVPERLRLLDKLGRFDDAREVAEEARDLWPDDPLVMRWYADALRQAGQPAAALAFCRKQMRLLPATADHLAPAAVAAAKQCGQLDAWASEVAEHVGNGADSATVLILARTLRQSGEAAAALRLARALHEAQPDRADAAWELAAAQHATGDVAGLLATLATAVRTHPERAALTPEQLNRWMAWFADADAAKLVTQVRDADGGDFATDYVLAVAALAAGQDTLAEKLLDACSAARPDFMPAQLVQAQVLLRAYRWDAAKTRARRVLKHHPHLAEAHFVLAEAHDGLDENDDAERAYKLAIKYAPHQSTYALGLARHYRRLGDLLAAGRYFQTALRDDPTSGEALEGLLDCYVRSNKTEIARVQLDRVDRSKLPADTLRRVDTMMRYLSEPFGPAHLAALRLQFDQHPHDVATARLLAAGLYLRGRSDQALEIARRALAADADDFPLMILLANIHASRGDFAEAIKIREKLRARFPNRRSVLEPLAICYLDDFRIDASRALLEHLIETAPDDETRNRYRQTLGDSYLQFGQFDEALRFVDRWIAADPGNDALVFTRLSILVESGRQDDAFAALKKWFDSGQPTLERRNRFALFGVATGHPQDVATRLRTWLANEPNNAVLTERLVEALIAAKKPDEAFEVARKFEGTYADTIDRRIWMARAEAAQGKLDLAVKEYEAILTQRSLARPEQLQQTRRELIGVLLDADRYDDALARCRKWLDEAGGKPEALFEALSYKRATLQAAGRDEEAAAVMETLLQKYSPDDPGLLNDLGYTWVDAGRNLERATRMIRRAVARDPLNAAYLDSLGWAYYKAGTFAEARKYLDRAVRLRDGRDPVLFTHLGDTAWRQSDREAARRAWEQARDLLKKTSDRHPPAHLTQLLADVTRRLAALEHDQAPPVAPLATKNDEQ